MRVSLRGLLPLVDHHRHRVRHLLAGGLQDLLADQLRGQEALGLIRDVVGREVGRPFGKPLDQLRAQPRPGLRRCGPRSAGTPRIRGAPGSCSISSSSARLSFTRVDLVEQQQHGRARGLHQFQGLAVLVRLAPRRVDDVEQQVPLVQSRLHRLQHSPVEERIGLVYARRVHENDLRAGQVQHALDRGARGLRLGRHDGQLHPDQLVQQRRLARVRPSQDGDEAGDEAGLGRRAHARTRSIRPDGQAELLPPARLGAGHAAPVGVVVHAQQVQQAVQHKNRGSPLRGECPRARACSRARSTEIAISPRKPSGPGSGKESTSVG